MTALNHSLLIRFFSFAILLSTWFLFSAGKAFAESELAQNDSKTSQLEEITVTALRSAPITLHKAPIAISAFQGEGLEDRGVDSFIDFLQEAPGTSVVQTAFGSLDIQIRGLSSSLGDSLIGYYVDEAPFSRLLSTNLPDFGFFDLERIEVLRGPQGTLYGAGATGGVIRILTKDPELNNFSTKGDIGFSQFDGGELTTSTNLAVNAPLGEKAAMRFTGSVNNFGGYIEYPVLGQDDANDAKSSNFRSKLLVNPSDKTTIILSATRNNFEADTQSTSEKGWVSNKTLVEPSRLTDHFYSGVFKWGGRHFNLVSSTSFVESELSSTNDFIGAPFILEFELENFVQEIRLNSTKDGVWNWTGGGYYADREQQRLQDATAVFGPLAIALERDTSKSYTVYGDLTRTFAEGRFQASLGAR